jgi:hypothetical protein
MTAANRGWGRAARYGLTLKHHGVTPDLIRGPPSSFFTTCKKRTGGCRIKSGMTATESECRLAGRQAFAPGAAAVDDLARDIAAGEEQAERA